MVRESLSRIKGIITVRYIRTNCEEGVGVSMKYSWNNEETNLNQVDKTYWGVMGDRGGCGNQ